MLGFRRKLLLLLSLLCFPFFLYFYGILNDDIEHKFFRENYYLLSSSSGSRQSVNRCQIPVNIDPFDDSIRSFIKNMPSSIKCKNSDHIEKDITFVEYINGKAFLKMKNDPKIKCFYQLFEKSDLSDDEITYHKFQQLSPSSLVLMDKLFFANVSCYDSNMRTYQKIHYSIPESESKQNLSKNYSSSDEELRPSVFILVIESLSRLNYLRFMPKTKYILEKSESVTYMKGLTKLADNSFPNMVPFLTGKRVYVGEYTNESTGPYDDWPFVWNKFGANGYSTALIEDHPEYTLFNYESKGFVKGCPTHFYPRPFWLHMYKSHDTSDYCLDQKIPKIEVMFDQIRTFIRVNHQKSRPVFIFSFYIEVTHDDFNKAQLIDFHVSQLIDSISQSLNNTILVLMGDHGNRYGPILETVIGRIEERMPLFAIHLPKSLNERYPHLKYYLEQNSDKLMGWLDLHQLLLDIIKRDYWPLSDSRTHFRDNVYSPWRQLIPSTRTCAEALIPENYCVCDERRRIDTNHTLVVKAGDELIAHVNQLLPISLCHRLTMNSIQSAEIILPSESIAKTKGFEQRIEITIKVNPSKAVLRGQLSRNAWNPGWDVKEDVTRLNRYENQSYCVHERTLKKFCYCL